MKKIVILTFLLAFLQNCKKNEEGVPCLTPPPEFTLFINKNSEVYKEFITQGREIDKAHISLYREEERVKKQYQIQFHYAKKADKNEYLVVSTQLGFQNDVYTGRTETFYLQNTSKTYKIEVNGYMKDTNGCGVVAVTNEIYVDGTKIEVPYLAK